MRKVINLLIYIHYFVWGHLSSLFLYEKIYVQSKHFKGKYFGLKAPGWKWATADAFARIFLGKNNGIRFPVSPNIMISDWKSIRFHPDDLNNFQGVGNYYQCFEGGLIHIGKGSYIAPNVGMITSNHDVTDLDKHTQGKSIHLGQSCWIGMNSVILPGVILGDNTVVGAGSIVTKSFPEGHCVIVGNPAKKIKDLDMYDTESNKVE